MDHLESKGCRYIQQQKVDGCLPLSSSTKYSFGIWQKSLAKITHGLHQGYKFGTFNFFNTFNLSWGAKTYEKLLVNKT